MKEIKVVWSAENVSQTSGNINRVWPCGGWISLEQPFCAAETEVVVYCVRRF